jgi:hypothetical protein
LHGIRTLSGLVLAALLVVAIVSGALIWHRRPSPEHHSIPPAPPPATLAGYVTDGQTRAPLPGVTLTIEDWETLDGRSPTSTTDDAGRFRYNNLRPSDDPARQVRLIATKPGYETSTADPPLGANEHPIKLNRIAPSEDRP